MYLGLDLGSSGLKAVLTGENGSVIDTETVPVKTQYPQSTWVEQNPDDWWQALCQSLNKLGERCDLSTVKSIGLAGHMHGAVLLDTRGQVIRPCIQWNDGRSEEQCRTLENGIENFRDRCGNVAMPGFTAPKVLWVRDHEPENFALIHKVLLPKDYLRFRLTGEFWSDMSDAAGTLWLNPKKREWDDELLQITGLERRHMPNLVEGSQITGQVSRGVAAMLGVGEVPVVGGAGDNAAGAIGVGVTEPGQGLISLGTSGVYFVVSALHRAAPEQAVHAFCHCLPRRWHQMSVMLSAASCLDWLANLIGVHVMELLDELESSGVRETEVIFLPYLTGERTPHNDPNLRAQFHGLSSATTRAEMTLAVLEGVTYGIADGEDALKAANTPLQDITLIGGGARSTLWRQLIADVLQRPIHFREGGVIGPGLGAARLAQLGLQGDDDNRIAAICPPPPIVQTHTPDPQRADYFSRRLALFRQIHQLTTFGEKVIAN